MSTVFWEKYREYTVAKLQQATVSWEPYWHVVIQDTLHPDLYKLCMQNWPDMQSSIQGMRNQPQGYNQNRRIYTPESGELKFWREYYHEFMEHTDIQRTVYGLEELAYSGNRWTTSSLWEDYQGYSVSNHIDAHTIDVAWQVYLYCDLGEPWGTSLNDQSGTEIKRFPFIPNSSWIMRVDADSWHGCPTVKSTIRRSIMTRYMYKFKSV